MVFGQGQQQVTHPGANPPGNMLNQGQPAHTPMPGQAYAQMMNSLAGHPSALSSFMAFFCLQYGHDVSKVRDGAGQFPDACIYAVPAPMHVAHYLRGQL